MRDKFRSFTYQVLPAGPGVHSVLAAPLVRVGQVVLKVQNVKKHKKKLKV